MGWRPDEVRAATLHDFLAALEGWRGANGISDDAPTDDDVKRLDELMRRYPDG